MQKVRLTLAIACGLGCALAVTLWVTSHFKGYYLTRIETTHGRVIVSVGASNGALLLQRVGYQPSVKHNAKIEFTTRARPRHPRIWSAPGVSEFAGFGIRQSLSGGLEISSNRLWWMPLWFIAALFGSAGFWFHRRWRKNRPQVTGYCPVCGYDLRATPARCPECGHEPKSQEAKITAEGAGASRG
jgi:hypothetical protein